MVVASTGRVSLSIRLNPCRLCRLYILYFENRQVCQDSRCLSITTKNIFFVVISSCICADCINLMLLLLAKSVDLHFMLQKIMAAGKLIVVPVISHEIQCLVNLLAQHLLCMCYNGLIEPQCCTHTLKMDIDTRSI